MVTPSDFKNKYLEFVNVADSRVQLFIDEATLEVDECRAGDFYSLLLKSLTAHKLALNINTSNGSSGSTGLIGGMSEGDTSVNFGTLAPTSDSQFYYQQTSYGIEYLSFLTMLGAGGTIV